MAPNLANLRNIGIIAHIDAGKTTLTERMLYYAGATHRMGEVDKGTTETDFDEEEQQRGITIYSACVSFPWNDVQVNLIDTPGHVDFTAEVERSLRVLDGGVVVFSAREGVEAQSETVWRQADKYRVPRIAFINKMDREGADFSRVLAQIRQRLGSNPVPLTVPVGAGPPHVDDAFRGIIDLVEMQFLTFLPESQGREIERQPIPEDLLPLAHAPREALLDNLYDYSDELMQYGLEEQAPPPELIRRVVREATLHHMIVPVFCGSALDYVGVQPVLDAVAHYLPGPADMPPVQGFNPRKKDAKETRRPSPEEPFCGLVFKIVADRHGDLCFVRVYSGTLKANTRVYNAANDEKENVAQLWHVQAGRREQVKEVVAGDITAIIGLRHSVTGDTLCTTQHPIVLESIVFPETVMSMAIEPDSATERKKLADVLERMKRQDPTFAARESEETGQTIISGMGELHLEIIKNRLLRDFNLNVKVHKPRVSYRETIAHAAEVTGRCHRQMAGQQHTAAVTIRMEPLGDAAAPITVQNAAGDSLPPEFVGPVMQVLRELGAGSGTLGFPLMKVRITVLGAEVHETESTELAFQHAAADAFEKGLREAGNVLLEPIMSLEITTPEEHLGDFVADLQQRRAAITRTEILGNTTVIHAEAPLAGLFGYSSTMRSLSQGRATCSMQPSAYGSAPPELLKSFL